MVPCWPGRATSRTTVSWWWRPMVVGSWSWPRLTWSICVRPTTERLRSGVARPGRQPGEGRGSACRATAADHRERTTVDGADGLHIAGRGGEECLGRSAERLEL